MYLRSSGAHRFESLSASACRLLNSSFEDGVANEFLGLTDSKGKLSGAERDKVRKRGPITRANLDLYWADRRKRENAGDPVAKLQALIAKVKAANKGKKLSADTEKLRAYISENPTDADELKKMYRDVLVILDSTDTPEQKVQKLANVIAKGDNQSVSPTADLAPDAPEKGTP